MPYSSEHKARTRARIIESARVMFNRYGFDQVSIDDIMNEAGLTRGGFYHHFKSKAELYAEAVISFTTCNPFVRQVGATQMDLSSRELARKLIELYLSDDVLANVDQHCPLIALPSDAARAGLKPRAAYTQVIRNMLRQVRSAFAVDDPKGASKAQAIVSLCVGGMVLARTTDDARLRKSLRAAALAQALALLDGGDHA